MALPVALPVESPPARAVPSGRSGQTEGQDETPAPEWATPLGGCGRRGQERRSQSRGAMQAQVLLEFITFTVTLLLALESPAAL